MLRLRVLKYRSWARIFWIVRLQGWGGCLSFSGEPNDFVRCSRQEPNETVRFPSPLGPEGSQVKNRKPQKVQNPLNLMAITLTTPEQQELAEQTKRDPAVSMSFYEWYGRFRQSAPDDVSACQLALGRQREVFREVYQGKVALYVKEARQDYRARLMNLKRLPSGPRFKTKSGIRVRSKAEKIIADFLFERGLQFAYEPIVELSGYYVMPDFHLTDYDVYLEHFGRDDQDYLQSAQAKLERCRQANVHLVWTRSADEPDIEEVLTWKLREAGVPM
jgi:hypothetical protein